MNTKKLLLIGSLILQSSLHAATTGTLTLSGIVAAATAIVVTGSNNYNSLDLSTTATDLTIATVREINNTSNGYTVTLSSQNAGALKNGSVGSLVYTAKYNASAVTLSQTPVTITNAGPSNTVINTTKNLQISYTGVDASQMMMGTYTDTLTFTISAN